MASSTPPFLLASPSSSSLHSPPDISVSSETFPEGLEEDLVEFLSRRLRHRTLTTLRRSNESFVFLDQHYAMAGLKTCLVIHSQDPTADYLLNCKIGTSPITCHNNLSAVRLETTKMLLEPLNRLKQADARINMTQGVLEGVGGGRRAWRFSLAWTRYFSALALERLAPKKTIRMIGATSKARLYLKYLRNLAERTDLGRLAGPSLLRLADEAISLSGNSSRLNGKLSAEIWDNLEQIVERGSSVFEEPSRFGCYLVMDQNNPVSVNSALRYWGCAIQAGAQVSGAFGFCVSKFSCRINGNSQEELLTAALFPSFHLSFTGSFSRLECDNAERDQSKCTRTSSYANKP
ncbi:P-loop containing nucleoside triphosphate hydrolases superfamily protein [Actinidia rufa]|uniref:P-loop containing nucleoside triphosphate hydrolases superfamily protein n=1 Tax=Actinidia rufa TaxID=165716 RepID=A0A7J0GZD3_9ERIC|nr:P-loop containing nucleoside triphosphate hydrolases superfamily protein [Actinidia rufa]